MKRIIGFIFLVVFISLAQAQSDFLQLARTGTADEVRAAIAVGADVNMTDQHGQSPLFYAIYNRDPEVLTVLLEAGADINARTNSLWTPLMYAARDTSNPEVVIRLLEHGATVSLRNPQGLTALNYASQNEALRRSLVPMHLFNFYHAEDAGALSPSAPSRDWRVPPPRFTVGGRTDCCRVCRDGKACGNSCIAAHLECHQPRGCACDANDPTEVEHHASLSKPMLFLTSFACDASSAAYNHIN